MLIRIVNESDIQYQVISVQKVCIKLKGLIINLNNKTITVGYPNTHK